MNIKRLCDVTNKNELIFESVIYRHFGTNSTAVINELKSGGYVKESKLYKCPLCSLSIGRADTDFEDLLKEKTICCYNCDKEFKTNHIRVEPLYIRTDRVYVEK